MLGSLAGEQPKSVDDVLASYDHSNTINLFALGALVAWLRGEVGRRKACPRPARGYRRPMSSCRSLPRRRTCARNLGIGAAPQPLRRSAPAPILASMYRHLAHAPAFLQRLEAALAPVDADGSLARAIAANRADAHERAKRPGSGDQCGEAADTADGDRSRASRPSSITPSARWSPSAARSAWRAAFRRPRWSASVLDDSRSSGLLRRLRCLPAGEPFLHRLLPSS